MSIQYSVATNLTAVGTTINNSLKLQPNYDYYFIESSTPNSGVQIPFCESGTQVTIVNHTANNILAYPQATGTINNSAGGTPLALQAGVSIRFITDDGLNFHSLVDTSSAVAPILTPNQVMATDGAGLLIGAGGYSSAPGAISSFVITDFKGNIPMATISPVNITASGNISGVSVNANSMTVSGTATINSLSGSIITSGNITSSGPITGQTLTSSSNAVITNVMSAGSITSDQSQRLAISLVLT
jgi:hypothetical protein